MLWSECHPAQLSYGLSLSPLTVSGYAARSRCCPLCSDLVCTPAAVGRGGGPGGHKHQWPATRRPTQCAATSATTCEGGVRGSGVEKIMLITEQDKFPGMTRGLAKPGGRQSRGDSWVGVCTYHQNHLCVVGLAFKTLL